MSVVSDRNTTPLKRPSRIYRATFSTIICLELGDGVAAKLAAKVVLALMVMRSALWTLREHSKCPDVLPSLWADLLSVPGKDSPQSG